MKNRSRWIIIALVVVGLAGLAYFLTQPKKGTVSAASGGTGIAGFLNNLFSASPSKAKAGGGIVGFLNNLVDAVDGNGNTGQLPAVGAPTYVQRETTAVDGTDQGSGNYTANPDWTVGDYGAPSGTDYLGNPFIRSSAPIIPFEAKNRPYRHGVDYDFAEQTARGAALLLRFPPFQLADVRIHMMGPLYADPADNVHFSRGVETMNTLPSFRHPGPTNVMELPRARKNSMMPDDTFWHYAGVLAGQLGDADPKTDALRQFAENHRFVLDADAYRLLGRTVWNSERNTVDSQREGILYMSIDIELTEPFEHHQYCSGWLYEGYCGAAAEAGFAVKPYLYSEGTQQVGIHYISNRQNGGDPEYLNPQYDFLANQTPVIQACQQYGGVLAIDTYLQAIWGMEPLLARDPSGSPIIAFDGKPVFSDLTETTAYGVTFPLEFEEAEKCLRDIYEQSNRLYLQLHRLAGQYPSVGGMRRVGLENTESGSFTRYTNEGVQGIVQNDRPVPAWLMDLFNALNMFLSDNLWCWGVDFNHIPTALGADNSATWQYQAHGVAEIVIHAAHKHSAFTNIQGSAFKWCWFNLAIVNDMNPSTGDGYHQKALCHGKIRNVNGTVWLEIWLAFPASDSRSTLFQVWVNQGSNQSVAYQCELQSGRHYFYDAFQLPQSFDYDSLNGENVFVTYPDTLDVQRTHAGDHRVSADGMFPPESQVNPPEIPSDGNQSV